MKKILFAFTLLFLLASCINKSTKFEGTWQSIKNHEDQLIITKAGDNFIIQTNYFGQEEKVPAIYNKEKDDLEVSSSLQPILVIYDPNSKHIMFNEYELEKIK